MDFGTEAGDVLPWLRVAGRHVGNRLGASLRYR